MTKFSPLDHLKFWITIDGYPDWDLEEDHASGTYGLVFFLNAKYPNSFPSTIALKTLNPETLGNNPEQLEELQREFAKWIKLPPHRNVLDAHRFKTAPIAFPDPIDSKAKHWVNIPVISMTRMKGSLEDWIQSSDLSPAAQLAALAQAFSGLDHLYSNGIQSHADLKPANILYTSEPSGLPSNLWTIKIADFGWSDVWNDYGYANKSLRKYIAPERLGSSPAVVPEKSDIFSMGIISAEILTGKHPMINLIRASKSEGEWIRRTTQMNWDLSGLPSENLRQMILQCLDPSPYNRPTAWEAVVIICRELERLHGIDLEPTLNLWKKESTQSYFPFIPKIAEEIDLLRRTLGLGKEVAAKSIRRLRDIKKDIKINGIYSMETWLQCTQILINFLESDETPLNQMQLSELRLEAKNHLYFYGQKKDSDWDNLRNEIHEDDKITAFEHFSHLIGHLAEIVKINFEQVYDDKVAFSSLGKAAFSYHRSSNARAEKNPLRSPIEYLDISISLQPNQAVPYYFRSLRRREILFFEKCGIPSDLKISKAEIIEDLEIACRLDPDWSEPKGALQQVLKSQ